MGILIKGMDEIPEDGAVLVVKHDNGKAYIKHACTYGYSMELVKLPAVQPETATVTIGRTKGSVTMWYECDACGEPIDKKDCYCRNCGRKLTLPEPYKGGETE